MKVECCWKEKQIHERIVELDSRPEANDENSRNFLRKVRSKVDCLLIILPGDDANRYNKIVLFCDKMYGLKNICVLGDRASQKMSNICLKANLKMGGVNFVASNTSLGFIERNETMVVRHAQELSDQTPKADYEIFSDGISQTQYGQSPREELPQLHQACDHVVQSRQNTSSSKSQSGQPSSGQPASDPPVRITFIVCAKRHHTRFYKANYNNPDEFENPPRRTYVDRDVTEEAPWDFYFQSHTPLQGTARPAYYIVLHDEISSEKQSLMADRSNLIAKITQSMCYLFGRSTGS
ncbi:MAG: hypothetical protein Q9193_001293, partial [Seirophora villosa]